MGDRHLVNPKFFVAAHCVVVWVTVLWGTTTCILCTHGRTFCSLLLKWNLIAQPCVMFIRSMGEPVLAQVVGHSEHGDAYRRITYDLMARPSCTTVRLFGASHCHCSLSAPPCPGGVVPQGGVGDRHLVTIPQGVVGTVFPGVGNDKGGEGTPYQGAVVACVFMNTSLWIACSRFREPL